MSIVLVGSTSGSVTLQEPAIAGTTVLDLPATSGTVLVGGTQNIPKSALPTGSVLQVVSATKTDTFSTTSTSFVDVTGLSVSITPSSSSSKILVMLTCGSIGNVLNTTKLNIVRNSTNIAQPASGTISSTINHFPGGSTNSIGDCASFLDSPATTSATTYKIQFAVDGSTGYLNRHTGNTDYNSVSTITVMEIAA